MIGKCVDETDLDLQATTSIDLQAEAATSYELRKACIDYCKGKGYTWAAVQDGWDCLCGNQAPNRSECFTECEDNVTACVISTTVEGGKNTGNDLLLFSYFLCNSQTDWASVSTSQTLRAMKKICRLITFSRKEQNV